MLKKLEKELTHEVRNEWISVSLECKKKLEVNDVEDDIEWLYSFAGLEKPEIYIAGSLFEQKVMVNKLHKTPYLEKIKQKVKRETEKINAFFIDINLLWAILETRFIPYLMPATMRGFLSSWNWTSEEVRQEVPREIWEKVREDVYEEVRRQVRLIWQPINRQVRREVEEQGLKYIEEGVGLCTDSDWLAFWDCLSRAGVRVSMFGDENVERFVNFFKKGAWNVIWCEDSVFISMPPKKVLKDSEGRLHSTKEAAVQWMDGRENYFIRGVSFDKELWYNVAYRLLDITDILKIGNMEQRFVALAEYGPESFLDELHKLDASLINKSERGHELYEIRGIIEGRKLKLVVYEDPSTRRLYASFVPDYVKTADEAMGWKFGLTEEEYKKLKRES